MAAIHIGKCKKCGLKKKYKLEGGAGRKEKLRDHYLSLLNNDLSEEIRTRLYREYKEGLRQLSINKASPRNWYTLGLIKKPTDRHIADYKDYLLLKHTTIMDRIVERYYLLIQNRVSRQIQDINIPKIQNEDIDKIEQWYNILKAFNDKERLGQNIDVEKAQFMALNRKIHDKLIEHRKYYGVIPDISHKRTGTKTIFTFTKGGKRFSIDRETQTADTRSKAIRFLKKYPFYLYGNPYHATIIKRNKDYPNILEFVDSAGMPFDYSDANNTLTDPDLQFFMGLIRDAGLRLNNGYVCPNFQVGPNCWLWTFINSLYNELTPEEITKRLGDVLIRLDIVPANEEENRILLNAVLQTIGQKIAEEGILSPEQVLPGHRNGFGKCKKCGLKKK